MHANTLAAYEKMKADGLLSVRRLQVLEAVIALGGVNGSPTAREVGEYLQVFGPRACNANSRLIELEARGVVKRAGTKDSDSTGFAGDTWEPTGELPTEPTKREGRTEQLRREKKEAEDAAENWRRSYIELVEVCHANGFKHGSMNSNGPARLAEWLEARLSGKTQLGLFS
jgi:hypothetical protein